MRAKVAFGDLSQNCFADQQLGILLRKTTNFALPSPCGRHYVGLPQPAKVAVGDLSQNCFADQRLGILLRKTTNFALPSHWGRHYVGLLQRRRGTVYGG